METLIGITAINCKSDYFNICLDIIKGHYLIKKI